MSARDATLLAATDVAVALLGAPAEVEHLRGGGRNSRIYRIRRGDETFALKQYPSQQDDPRDRLGTEVGALRLMERYGINAVPRVIAMDCQRGFVLLSWIEGSPVVDIGEREIDAAGAFLSTIHQLRHATEADRQPLAAEACLSGAEIERQIRARVGQLAVLAPDEADCRDFVVRSFNPAFERILAGARTRMQAAGLDFDGELPQERRSLIPADFGFHNSLRRGDGTLAFVDFEYFGWDDPVKLTADVLLHPGASLALPQYRRFRAAAERLYGDDPSFDTRLDAFLPLFGLRWVLILLNEFLPERWQRRVLAGATESWTEAKSRQLGKARDLLAQLA